MPFTKLGLSDQLVQGILATGYTAPTAIQTQAIPLALAGRDLIGCAQTGTGKTAAFMLPIIHHLTKHPHHSTHPRALILVPTRELAQQVEDFSSNYGRFTSLRVLSVYGGVNMANQIKRFQRGIDIVVATPGRLIDHLTRRTVDLSHVEILVLDEADRMFDMGFIQDVRRIIARVPAKRQTLLFSATMSAEVKELTASVQHNPELIEIGEQRRPVETVQQHFYKVQRDVKLPLLVHILKEKELTSVLVFARTKHGADKISRRLERSGFRSVAIHSNRTQAQRERALAGFRNGQFAVLVATDIAARGIDVEGISHVINFDTPSFAEDYIHRIGRTGRAESRGDAITFVSGDEMKNFRKIEHYTSRKFTITEYPNFVPSSIPDEGPRESGEPQRTEHRHRTERPRKPQEHRRESPRSQEHPRPHGQKPGGPASRTVHNERRQPRERNEQRPHGTQPQRTPHSPQGGERQRRPFSQQQRTPQGGERQRRPFNPHPQQRTPQGRPSGPKRTGGKNSPPATPSLRPIVENDWRKLLSLSEQDGTLRKKLRKFFKRG